jgi:hypothetical protein
MAVPVSEYELEALPELEAEGELQNRRFFGVLSNLARRVLPSRRSLLTRVAMSAARQGARRGFPALRRAGISVTDERPAGWMDPSVALREPCYDPITGELKSPWDCPTAGSSEAEISPIRRIYPDAMMEHLGHAAAETQSEAEAQALAGAMVPLAARIVPRAAPAIMRAAPGLVCGLTGVVNTLRRDPATRPLVRMVPAIVRNTAASIAQQASRGVSVTPQAAVRTLARQTVRVLGSPKQAARAFNRSRVLDRQFHRTGGAVVPGCPTCSRCGAIGR